MALKWFPGLTAKHKHTYIWRRYSCGFPSFSSCVAEWNKYILFLWLYTVHVTVSICFNMSAHCGPQLRQIQCTKHTGKASHLNSKSFYHLGVNLPAACLGQADNSNESRWALGRFLSVLLKHFLFASSALCPIFCFFVKLIFFFFFVLNVKKLVFLFLLHIFYLQEEGKLLAFKNAMNDDGSWYLPKIFHKAFALAVECDSHRKHIHVHSIKAYLIIYS